MYTLGVQILLFLVAFTLLFYFVSPKDINELKCIVKQISVCCIHGLKVDVLILVCPCKLTNFILISDQNVGR
jgi:hypothetical protein